jgi:purine-cytosine permease-like protein
LLALLHAENYYLPFLSALGVALPPVGALLVLHMLTFWRRRASSGNSVPLEKIRLSAVIAWLGGTVVGYLGMRGVVTLTGIAALDSIGAAAVIWIIGRLGAR